MKLKPRSLPTLQKAHAQLMTPPHFDITQLKAVMIALMVIEEAASDLPVEEQEVLRRALERLKVRKQ